MEDSQSNATLILALILGVSAILCLLDAFMQTGYTRDILGDWLISDDLGVRRRVDAGMLLLTTCFVSLSMSICPWA